MKKIKGKIKNVSQIEMISLEDLVPESHMYRKYAKLIDFQALLKDTEKELKTEAGAQGFGITRLFQCLRRGGFRF